MKLHTLTRKTEEFKPLDGRNVRMYSCGPTVYDHPHIGNLSGFVYIDTLRRVLKASGYDVRHVMNITDVEDKIITRSQERHPELSPEDAMKQLTQHYTQLFMDNVQAVGNDIAAMEFIRATDSIEGMRALIRELHDGGFAYIADSSIYFSIEKYKASGKTYGQLLDITSGNTSAARIDNDEYDKASVHDFALWKGGKPGEPAWEFELDGHDLTGRPGWHIECSAMSVAALGQPFDIHTGGVDLIFPHHENEIAQSTAGGGTVYAKTFVHNEHLLVDGRKMSKSLGNFFTIQDVLERGHDPLAFRLMILQSHYRSQANFTWDVLEAASNRLQTLQQLADLRWQPVGKGNADWQPQQDEILKHLQNDLDTPQALATLSKLADQVTQTGVGAQTQDAFGQLLAWLDNLLGLDLGTRPDITHEQKDLLTQRQKARDAKDWPTSDNLRDQLKDQGIAINDAPNGQSWYRTNS